MKKNTLLGAAVFGLASVLNPAFFTGCGGGFSFGEAEVVALVESTSAERYLLETSEGTYEIGFTVAQARGEDSKSSSLARAAVRVAHACGNRTFMRSAAACIDVTDVPIAGTITIRRIAPDAITLVDSVPAAGRLSVSGTRLDNADLDIKAGEGDGEVWLRSADGKTFSVRELTVAGKRFGRPL